MFVGSFECLKAFSSIDVPNFDSRVCISWNKNISSQLHSTRQRLMSNQSMSKSPWSSRPNSNRCVKRTTYDVFTIKLKWINPICVSFQSKSTRLGLDIPNFDQEVICSWDDDSTIKLDTSNSSHMTNQDMTTFSRNDVPNSKSCISRSWNDMISVESHASDCWSMSIKSVKTLAWNGIPNFKGPVSWSTDYNVRRRQLRRPYSSSMSSQSSETLPWRTRPYFKCVIITSTHDKTVTGRKELLWWWNKQTE